jgi:DNA polymerase-3 subunit delta'
MPTFAEIRGQESAHDLLRGAAARGRLPHAYLFHGAPGVGKTTTALALAQYINCDRPRGGDSCGTCPPCRKLARLKHPDLHWLFPMLSGLKGTKRADHIRKTSDERLEPGVFRFHFSQAASIAIGRDSDTRAGSIGELRHQAGMTGVEARVKTFVISEADRMTDAAANSLLKVLEEPPPDNLLVLCTSNPGAMLDTIMSRCQGLRFRDLSEDEIVELLVEREGAGAGAARLAAALGQGSLTRAAALAAEDVVALRDQAVAVLSIPPDDPRSHEAVRELAATKDREVIHRLLDFGLLWQSDLLRVLTGSDVPPANRDREALLREQASGLDVAEVRRRVAAIDAARRAMAGNVYLPLVIRGLLEGLAGRPVFTT